MPLPRPSVVIKAFLEPQLCSEAMECEFKRSFMIIAQSLVEPLPDEEAGEGNCLRLCVRMHRPYWDCTDPAAQELWEGSLSLWLENLLRNLNNTMRTFNQVLHPAGADNLDFASVELEFGGNVSVRFALADNRLPESAAAMVEELRRLMADGAFGEGEVATVAIPSAASLAARKAALEEAAMAAEEREAEGEGEPAPVSDIPLDYNAWGISFSDGRQQEYAFQGGIN